jgi:GntR family transcriptional regulator
MPPRTPVFRRIVSDLRARIETGDLKPGDRLPTQRELEAQYECSSQPVKMALTLLSEMGLTEGQQGRGVYVTERPRSV